MKTIASLMLAACGLPALAEEIKLPITADNSIAAFPEERDNNSGHMPRIKLKGNENFILFAVDIAPLKGKKVERATLHIRGCDDKMMVRKVGLSTISTAWTEGTGEGEVKAKAGESCFNTPAFGGDALWAGPGSRFVDAAWGRGGSFWTQIYVQPGKDQWYEIDLDPRVMEAYAAGISYGVVLSDDNGQTMNIADAVDPDTNHSNNYFFSREQNASMPYVTAEATAIPEGMPGVVEVEVKPWLEGADLDTGGLEISWPTGDEAQRKEILGYKISVDTGNGKMQELPHWNSPSVPPAKQRARALLRHQKPDMDFSFEVSVIGRGGMVVSVGKGEGKSSKAYGKVKPLDAPALPALGKGGACTVGDKGRCWAVPDLAKVNPITGNVAEEAKVAYDGEPSGTYREQNEVWDGAEHRIQLSGIRNEWIGVQLVCENLGETATWSIKTALLDSTKGGKTKPSQARLSRLWYQKVGDSERAWFADPMIPLESGTSFAIPDAKNAVPQQKNQTVYAEIFVPKDANPGIYAGEFEITCEGATAKLPLQLTVGSAIIPDLASFVWSMNAYSSPGEDFGAYPSDEFISAERSFYVMTHEHRSTLAWLGYSHSANFQSGVAWPLAGSGKDMKVSDWSAWDNRFGPLFDGSAFAGTTREGVALDHFYLPFMESWPTPMKDYKWNDSRWEDHWKVAGPIEEGFSQQYQDQWVAVMQDFLRHVKEKKWTTNFQVYLNDKYYYKKFDPKAGKSRAGTSYWLLDEPVHVDDFTALAFFGKLTRQAQQGDRSAVQYRCDISQPEWSRDLLDRLIDVNVSGGFFEWRQLLEGWRAQLGQRIWTYGGAPSSTASALAIERQALDLYTRGVDGFVPWLTLGGEQNWTEFVDTCVIYPGGTVGIKGACASLRLKAYRRGEQDVEYVRLLGTKLGLMANDPNRRRLAALVEGTLGGLKKIGTLDAEGAVTESFEGLQLAEFERLRRAIAAQLQ